MSSVIPCHRGDRCSWPACSPACDGRPGRELVEIVVECVGFTGFGPVWDTYVGDEKILTRCRLPAFDTARALAARGWPPETRYAMRHRSSPHVALTGSLGWAVGMDVHETHLTYSRYVPPRGPVEADSGASEPSPATPVP